MSPIALDAPETTHKRSLKVPFQASTDDPFSRRAEDGSYVVLDQPIGVRRRLKVAAIGGGASGINLAYKIQSHMKDVELVIYEKNPEIGGTWYENTYPGVACDTNSHGYAFTYHLKADWTQVFSPGAEIQEYMLDVVRTHNLRKYFCLEHQITSAIWDDIEAKWYIAGHSPSGPFEDSCDVLINAAGLLNNWRWPDVPGLEHFKGQKFHTATWPKEANVTDKRVALIGVGSSGIQVLPHLQKEAEAVNVFIRSPTWVAPPREGDLLSPETIARYRLHPEEHLEYCRSLESLANKRFGYIRKGSADQEKAYQAWTEHMKNGLQSKPQIYDNLHPKFAVGCRRPTPGPGFLDAMVADNVNAVFSGVKRIDEKALHTIDGQRFEVDTIVCATGFDVSFKPRFPVIGRNGVDLREQWSSCPRAYLSMFAANMPNYITMLGPGAPSAQGSIIVSIERISDYVIQMLDRLQTETIKTFEIQSQAVDELAEHTAAQLEMTVWTDDCSSWFKNGSKTGPVTALHPGGRLHFFAMLMKPRWEDFAWTYWNKNRYAYLGNGYTLREIEGRDDTWYLTYGDGLDLFKY